MGRVECGDGCALENKSQGQWQDVMGLRKDSRWVKGRVGVLDAE